MAVTASRMGHSPITLDWSQLGVRNPLDSESVTSTWQKLQTRFTLKEENKENTREVGFFDAPIQNSLSQAKESQELAQSLLSKNQFTDCLFLGIGGSALGPLSLLSSLQEKQNTGIRFHFVDNPDPFEWKSTLRHLKPSSTLVCLVTKSGTTFETLAQGLLALEWLSKDSWKTQVVAITDPQKGDLRQLAQAEGILSLAIAPSMGGRFSIFSPVGLFPAALAGLDITAFLHGAQQIRELMLKSPVERNPVFILANELLRQASQRHVHVCMPYSTRLRLFGAWFVQLWGESLGKDGKGFTPVAAVGATDQHSILQLLRDGPSDKVTFFIGIDEVPDEVKIPSLPLALRHAYPAFKILENHTLQELLTVEQRATSLVLTRNSRPHVTFKLDRLDERSAGALYFTFCILTSFLGTLWDINPFDQPGVEEGKLYIRQALQNDTG